MITVRELYDRIDAIIPRSLSCEWDNDGLMCSEFPGREVSSVLCALDVTDRVIDYAIVNGFDVIISHHPLIFKPLRALAGDDNISRKAIRLLSHKISVMSFHTRLDALDGGVNDCFAALLGLNSVKPFGHEQEMIGRIGSPCRSRTFDELCTVTKMLLGCEYMNVVRTSKPISRIALVGGDGKDFFRDALREGADVYITGTLSYNNMVDAAELGIGVIEAGHFFTENFICDYFEKLIGSISPEIQCESVKSNPVAVF